MYTDVVIQVKRPVIILEFQLNLFSFDCYFEVSLCSFGIRSFRLKLIHKFFCDEKDPHIRTMFAQVFVPLLRWNHYSSNFSFRSIKTLQSNLMNQINDRLLCILLYQYSRINIIGIGPALHPFHRFNEIIGFSVIL